MCRSKANGGRRCPGTHTTTTRTTAHAAAPATSAPAPTASTAAPDRERTDRLAAALPADRTGWDGTPLNERDRRFYALRESGYTGPINQDGYADTTSEGAGILRRMAERRGETVTW
jgi:hypothetical protein